MELKIGFKNKYWTLWRVESSVTSDSNGMIRTSFTYVQNLSTNYMKAMETAMELGCTDLGVYEILKNRSRSFFIDGSIDHPIIEHIDINLFAGIKNIAKRIFTKIKNHK